MASSGSGESYRGVPAPAAGVTEMFACIFCDVVCPTAPSLAGHTAEHTREAASQGMTHDEYALYLRRAGVMPLRLLAPPPVQPTPDPAQPVPPPTPVVDVGSTVEMLLLDPNDAFWASYRSGRSRPVERNFLVLLEGPAEPPAVPDGNVSELSSPTFRNWIQEDDGSSVDMEVESIME